MGLFFKLFRICVSEALKMGSSIIFAFSDSSGDDADSASPIAVKNVFFIFLSQFATNAFFNHYENDDDSGEQADEEFEVVAIDNCLREPKPVIVKDEFLPVVYENNCDGAFISKNGDTVSEYDINANLEGLPNMISDENFVIIIRPKTWLQEKGIEMKEGLGWKWDALEMCYTEVSQPDGENYGWNEQLQEFGELCDQNSGCFKPDWKKWVTYPQRDHDASKLLFSNKHGMYSTHGCLCDGCEKIFNPTDRDELRQHSFRKESSTVRRCQCMYDVGP